MAITSVLILFAVLLFPPSAHDILKTFWQNWLLTEQAEVRPHFYFPLHPTNFYPPERQEFWYGLTPPPVLQCDVNGDGIVNYIDYAYLVQVMGELNWFKENK